MKLLLGTCFLFRVSAVHLSSLEKLLSKMILLHQNHSGLNTILNLQANGCIVLGFTSRRLQKYKLQSSNILFSYVCSFAAKQRNLHLWKGGRKISPGPPYPLMHLCCIALYFIVKDTSKTFGLSDFWVTAVYAGMLIYSNNSNIITI